MLFCNADFFFSSRRRHTRFKCDWSSDVCSSDLYRFYHQSCKVFYLQERTQEIVAKLQGLAPALPMNEWFIEIIRQGTGKEFDLKDNENCTAVTRPILEAFFHARYFLEMAFKYGMKLDSPPERLPTVWAALPYFYSLR